VRAGDVLILVAVLIAILLLFAVILVAILSIFIEELKAYVYVLTIILAPIGLWASYKLRERR